MHLGALAAAPGCVEMLAHLRQRLAFGASKPGKKEKARVTP
jgi:hypothetical protein